jgi:hypothetical protein
MKKILKKLLVIQEISNRDRKVRLGKGFTTASRLNPYNPLSYLTAIIVLIVGILMFGFVGFWKEVDTKNPFTWY